MSESSFIGHDSKYIFADTPPTPTMDSLIGFDSTFLDGGPPITDGWIDFWELQDQTLLIQARDPAQFIRVGTQLYESTRPNQWMRVYNTGMAELGRGYWAGPVTVVDGNYQGPPFSGSSESVVYQDQDIVPSWDGPAENSESSFTAFYTPEFRLTADWYSGSARKYSLGTDRGMLYLDGIGYAWPGLTNVSRSRSGGGMEPRHIDGRIYNVFVPKQDYLATLECFTYPEEFDPCIGHTSPWGSGLKVYGQGSRPFDFSYRTLNGNGDGHDRDYIIHLVYGATAAEDGHDYVTINSSPEADSFKFEIQAVPPSTPGIRPTSYFQIDSRLINRALLIGLEKVLYGSDDGEASLPPLQEIVEYLYS